MEIETNVSRARGLEPDDARLVSKLVQTWREKKPRNDLRDKYYLSHTQIRDLGISMPRDLAKKIDPRCDWAKKAVHALANRSQFDGWTCDDEETCEKLRAVERLNDMSIVYDQGLISELKHCMSILTVTSDGDEDNPMPIVSAYPATASSAIWDAENKAIKAAMVVVETKRNPGSRQVVPSLIRVFTDEDIIDIERSDETRWEWVASYQPHSMGRCHAEPMAYSPTLERPFGQSVISRGVMSVIDDAIREKTRSELAAELAALPGKYILGTKRKLTDGSNKYNAAMGAIMEITKDSDGGVPTVGQFPQVTMDGHIQYMRELQRQFSEVSGIPLAELGIQGDSPSSAQAINAANEPMIINAKNLNKVNGRALSNVAYMCLAVMNDTDYVTEKKRCSIGVHWMSPAMPSIVSQSDAMVKQVAAIPWIGETEVALEELGYDENQRVRMLKEKRRADAMGRFSGLVEIDAESVEDKPQVV